MKPEAFTNDALFIFGIIIFIWGLFLGFRMGQWHDREKKSLQQEKSDMDHFKARIDAVRRKIFESL